MTDDEYEAMRAACVFCDYAGPSPILYEDMDGFVIEPIRPVVMGHVLVICHGHITDFAEDETFCAETMRCASKYASMIGMGDCNLITSRGAAATQSVPHLHIHLVPRRPGDGLHLPWTGQQTQRSHPPPPPTHICHACGERIEYGAHAHGCG